MLFTDKGRGIIANDDGPIRPHVVMLGDSIFDWTDDITMFLELYSGDIYRHYYVSASQMEGGDLGIPIPDQYAQAIADGYIRTIIMDGGGNDILYLTGWIYVP